MKLQKTTQYAILAIGYIAQKEGKIVKAIEIAEHHEIPQEYLLKILQQLVKANILRSKRGPQGGFKLDSLPKDISCLEIIQAVDGPFFGREKISDQTPNSDAFCNAFDDAYQRAANKARVELAKATVRIMLLSK